MSSTAGEATVETVLCGSDDLEGSIGLTSFSLSPPQELGRP